MPTSAVVETVDVPGRPEMPLNTWGKATMLLELLYVQGWLPECSIAGKEGTDAYFINGQEVGVTESEVTSSIWRMVECWKQNGYLFS